MSNANTYQMFGQSKGTLMPGQSIAVGQFNVQVERYLSQGGFAHVYLVRTATPVYNTTHHVLKRIAVENEAMLAEVKKEVDVMRLLKGHPNIVHLIDAAWHRMSNGTYEVFILMEYCPGGGIIDMMNRRLRERLTEAEILQIFVDVCEGVAYMHSSRPPLLHRDLKVENILQSSPTSFKLCDFGSATTVSPRPPSTAQEIRALEADLNRHTTLQYRAPEMVDLYLRRPVDEKSDVWALGVLLYKLCYYTTPFEEHGPLAILNVQYRTPPYPVYSTQMNSLIGSMLREHGVHRPTVFEILDQVHNLRGTKSQFHYNVPPPQPLSPRQSQFRNTPNKASQHAATSSQPSNGAITSVATPAKNAGVQAREMVLEAIAPMRRGRPPAMKEASDNPSSSRHPSPRKQTISSATSRLAGDDSKQGNWLDNGFDAEEEKSWKAIAATKISERQKSHGEEVWGGKSSQNLEKDVVQGFGDDFGQKLWDSFDPPPLKPKSSDLPTKPPRDPSTPVRGNALSPSNVVRPRFIPSKSRDAFDGLGLQPANKPEPTLGEARKLRTGLAVLSTASNRSESNRSPHSTSVAKSAYLSAQTPPMRGASSSPAPLPTSVPLASQSHSRSSSTQPLSLDLPAESRFPSLEELDASFASIPESRTLPVIGPRAGAQLSSQLQTQEAKSTTDPDTAKAQDSLQPVRLPVGHGGSRSAQVTGSAMRAYQDAVGSKASGIGRTYPPSEGSKDGDSILDSSKGIAFHKSGKVISPIDTPSQRSNPMSSFNHAISKLDNYKTSPPGTQDQAKAAKHAHDWLTGSDNEQPPISSASKAPALRASPNKRRSYIETSRPSQREDDITRPDPSPLVKPADEQTVTSNVTRSRLPSVTRSNGLPRPMHINTSDAKYGQTADPLSDNWSPLPMTRKATESQKEFDSQSSADEEGPEDANGFTPRPVKLLPERQKSRHKPRQSSVHDLVDLWGGGITTGANDKERKKDSSSAKPELGRLSPSKRASVNLNSPIMASFSRSTSPKPVSPISTDSRQNNQGFDSSEGKQSSPVAPTPSPASSRSRPQSMFAFPSRGSDVPGSGLPSSALSSSLSPPADTPRRPSRRTSISDMVQHYEAISKSTSVGLGPPPVSSKPLELRVPRLSNVRKFSSDASLLAHNPAPAYLPTPIPSVNDSPRKAGASLQLPNQAPSTESTQNRRSPTSMIHPSPSGRRQPEKEETKSTDDSILNKLRKGTTADDSNQPPSPEQPYQGVGKLIDQWQRKTAENEGIKGPIVSRRGGFAVRRGETATSAAAGRP